MTLVVSVEKWFAVIMFSATDVLFGIIKDVLVYRLPRLDGLHRAIDIAAVGRLL